MNSQNHEGSARRLEVAGDLSPIFVRELDKGNSQRSFYEVPHLFQKSVLIVSATWRGEPKEKKRTAITLVVV